MSKVVSRLCKAAKFEGFYTNHSLHVTAATRLFHHGVDEQIIMSVTGHGSVDGVRRYKRICSDEEKAVSELLEGSASKRMNDEIAENKENQQYVINRLPKETENPQNNSYAKPMPFNLFGCSATVNNN